MNFFHFLGQLSEWNSILREIKVVLWSNQTLSSNKCLTDELNLVKSRANQLLTEVNLAKDSLKQEISANAFTTNFEELLQKLTSIIETDNSNTTYDLFLIQSLMGAVEIHVATYMPLLDPVEKNRLKKQYCNEDIEHVQRLIFAYECMGGVMNYKYLGEASLTSLRSKLTELYEKLEKLNRKVALRPKGNQYTNLVHEVTHFLSTCCTPAYFFSILTEVEETMSTEVVVKLQLTELVQKIEVWTNNASKFLQDIKERFGIFYGDYVAPLDHSISLLTVGLLGVYDCLKIKLNQSECPVFQSKTLERLFTFPTVPGSCQKLLPLVSTMDHSDSLFFKLVKAELISTLNRVTIRKNLNTDFQHLDEILALTLHLWKTQEELKKKKQEEEDSLYITRTRCEDESDDVVAQREIIEMFPTFIDDDFADFIQRDTLEQVVKIDKKAIKSKHLHDIVTPDDFKLICETFINVMGRYTNSWYYEPSKGFLGSTGELKRDYLTPFEIKMNIYMKLFNTFKNCLTSDVDSSNIASICFIIGLVQQKYGNYVIDAAEKKFDFYNDSNITEILSCGVLLDKIEGRVKEQLEQWPEHAVLNDVSILGIRLVEDQMMLE